MVRLHGWRYPRLHSLAALAALLLAVPCIAQARIAQYNLARFYGDTSAIESVFAALEADDKPGYATAPHIYVFQEVRGDMIDELGDIIASAHPTYTYARATFTTSDFEDGSGGAQALYYRTDRVSEVTAGHKDISTGAGRRTDRWLLRFTGYEFDLFVYSCHLKAGQSDDEDREDGALSIRADADSLPAGSHVIYIGDYNFYSNNEAGYQVMTGPGNAQAVDPLGTSNWTGSTNAVKHTQSPRSVTADSLVGGGMDDRFDQHLVTAGLNDGSGFAIVDYRAFGNDGFHYNDSINDGNNSYYPGDIARSNQLADDLFEASDHIPVVVDYQFPGLVSAYVQDDQGSVIRDAVVQVEVLVANAAPGDVVDTCPVYVEGTSGIYGDDTIMDVARLPAFDTVILLLDTSNVGDISGIVRVEGLGQDVGGAEYSISTSAVVIEHAQPSFSGASLVSATQVDVDCPIDEGAKQVDVDLFNFNYTANQATMTFDSVLGLPSGIQLVDAPAGSIGSTPGTLSFEIDPAVLGVGEYIFELDIVLDDQDLPGATEHQLDLTLAVAVEGEADRPGDLDGNGVVDGADLAMILGAWGTAKYDLTGDGIVSGADLSIVLGDWG